MRKTKFILTLGPATDHGTTLEDLILAGMDFARINMSHGNLNMHATRITELLKLAKKHHKNIGILIDLQGAKIRIGKFLNKTVYLKPNSTFTLDPDLDQNLGTEHIVYLSYPDLYKYVQPRDQIFLDDGKITLQVARLDGKKIVGTVQIPGNLADLKGVNLQGKDLPLPALTAKDHEDLVFATQFNIAYFGLSFVKSAADVIEIKQWLKEAQSKAKVLAKIETPAAIADLQAIAEAADGLIVARGDLGIELGLAKLPFLQKKIIRVANTLNKPAIVATQIMESMIDHCSPTRAEVLDLANAILDGADLLAFCAETAIGKHPELVLKFATAISEEVEKMQ